MKKRAVSFLFAFLIISSICLTGCQKPDTFPVSGKSPSSDAQNRFGAPPGDTLVSTEFSFFSLTVDDNTRGLLYFGDDEATNPEALSAPYDAGFLRFASLGDFNAYVKERDVPLDAQTLEKLASYPTPGQVLLINLTWSNRDYYTLSSEVMEDALEVVLHFHTNTDQEPLYENTSPFALIIDKGFGDRYSLKVQ